MRKLPDMSDTPNGFRKMIVEIMVPDTLDDSDLLEKIQEFAVELAEDEIAESELDLASFLENETSVYRAATS